MKQVGLSDRQRRFKQLDKGGDSFIIFCTYNLNLSITPARVQKPTMPILSHFNPLLT